METSVISITGNLILLFILCLVSYSYHENLFYCSSSNTENNDVIYFPPLALRILKYGIHWVYMDFKLRFSLEKEYSFLFMCRSMILCPKPMRSQILGKLPCRILGTEPMSSESIKHSSLLSHLYSPLKLLFTWP